MNLQDIREMYDYNYWANGRILDTAENVTRDQFYAPSTHSFSSLRGTLLHTLSVEFSWRNLLEGHGFGPALDPSEFPTVAAIRLRWQDEEQAMRRYIDSLRDEDLTGIVRYEGDTGIQRERVIWHCLYHVVNHGMQHRSEAAHLLTTYGKSPGEIDFTIFLNGRKAQQEQPR